MSQFCNDHQNVVSYFLLLLTQRSGFGRCVWSKRQFILKDSRRHTLLAFPYFYVCFLKWFKSFFVNLKSNLALKSSKGHNLLKTVFPSNNWYFPLWIHFNEYAHTEFFNINCLPRTSGVQAGNNFKSGQGGSNKALQRKKIISPPNEWRNIPFLH